jgi:hypothetical protein
MQLLSSTAHIEYADISELKTLALQRAMSGHGTPPSDGAAMADRHLRRRRTRHDTTPEEREQLCPMYVLQSYFGLCSRLIPIDVVALPWRVCERRVRSLPKRVMPALLMSMQYRGVSFWFWRRG